MKMCVPSSLSHAMTPSNRERERGTIYAEHLGYRDYNRNKRHGFIHQNSTVEHAAVTHQRKHDNSHQSKELQDLQRSSFLEYSQGGAVQLSHRAGEHRIVALRTLKSNKINDDILHNIRKVRNRYVVGIEAALFDNGRLSIVREYELDITLRVMCGVLPTPVTEAEIAIILHHIVQGLSYVHNELTVVHGKLSCETVLISLFGAVRICTFADVFPRLL